MPLSPTGDIEIQEIEVLDGAPATRATLAELPLPEQCLIAAIIRESFIRVPGADDRLCPGDSIVALVAEGAFDETKKMFNPETS
jgi:trk system potassium uptake protein TrkA